MVASTRRSRCSVPDSRSHELSQSDQRLPQHQHQSCPGSTGTLDEVEKATATTVTTHHHAAASPSFSEKSPLSAADPPLSEPSSAPILLGCQICLKGKDSIVKPVVTYCGHMFCWGCLLDRLPPEGILRDEVRLPCPVCGYGLVGGCPNKSSNTVIPVCRKYEHPSVHLKSNEKPLPETNAFPISFFDEKIRLFHEVGRNLKSAEESFCSIAEHTQKNLDSVDEQFQRLLKRVGIQWSTSSEIKSE